MMRKLNILMLEDLPEDAGLVERLLRKDNINFYLLRVDTRQDFEAALDDFKPDIILSDHALPQFNSIEALKCVKNRNLQLPFILVTGNVSEEFAVNSLKMGASDYILKSNLSRLPMAIRHAIHQYEIDALRKKAERNLRRQNEELIKINQELDNFVYSVSHNLRAPLMSLLGLVQLAQHDDKHRVFSLYWDQLHKNINNLDGTLKEILDYSKNSRFEVTLQKINLNTLLEEVREKLKYLRDYEKVTFTIKIDQQADFYSDPFRLSVIFTNILSNSIKYNSQDRPNTILVEIFITHEQAHLTITDNGIGIAPDILPRVQEMFFRGSERSDGAGLGLYIVKEIVTKLKGSLLIESLINDYTCIRISIPNVAANPKNQV